MDSKPGLSLVELLVGMAILAFVSLMVGTVYLAHFKLFSNQNTQIDVSSQNRIALDEITNQIREANQVDIECCPGPTLISSGPNAIALRLWPLDPTTGNPYEPTNPNYGYDHVAYFINNNNLVKRIQATAAAPGSKRTNSSKILASNLAAPGDLQFSYRDSNGVLTVPPNVPVDATLTTEVFIKIKISSKSFDRSRTFSEEQESKAVLRNK